MFYLNCSLFNFWQNASGALIIVYPNSTFSTSVHNDPNDVAAGFICSRDSNQTVSTNGKIQL
jgi:hypothetical protein